MTTQEIIAIATQAAIAAVQASMGATAPVSNPTAKVQGSSSSRVQDKPKALPDATASAIGDIVAGATKEAVTNGKKIEEPKNEAVIFEYSEKMWAIYGDTRPEDRRAIIRKYGGERTARFGRLWHYHPAGAPQDYVPQGWTLPKSVVEKNGGYKAMLKEFKKAGLKMTEGESVREEVEAWRAAHPKEDKPKKEDKPAATTATPISEEKPKKKGQGARSKGQENTPKLVAMPTPSYEGIGFKKSGKFEGSFVQYAKCPDIFIHTAEDGKQSAYICIGEVCGTSAFLFVTNKVNADGTIENFDKVKGIAEGGYIKAVLGGMKPQAWHLEAFKSANDAAYQWLVKYEAA